LVSIAYPRFTDFARLRSLGPKVAMIVSIAYPRFTDFARDHHIDQRVAHDAPTLCHALPTRRLWPNGFNRLSAIPRLCAGSYALGVQAGDVSIAYPRFPDFVPVQCRCARGTWSCFNRLSAIPRLCAIGDLLGRGLSARFQSPIRDSPTLCETQMGIDAYGTGFNRLSAIPRLCATPRAGSSSSATRFNRLSAIPRLCAF